MPIRVILAEDSYLVREGVRRLLETETAIELVAVCEDYDSLLAAVERRAGRGADRHPHAAHRHRRGHPGRRRLRERRPAAGVVVLSQYDDPAYACALLESGSEGGPTCSRSGSPTWQLVAAIREVARGGSVIDPKVVEALVAARARGPRSRPSPA